jgi:hypothetical protein
LGYSVDYGDLSTIKFLCQAILRWGLKKFMSIYLWEF